MPYELTQTIVPPLSRAEWTRLPGVSVSLPLWRGFRTNVRLRADARYMLPDTMLLMGMLLPSGDRDAAISAVAIDHRVRSGGFGFLHNAVAAETLAAFNPPVLAPIVDPALQ